MQQSPFGLILIAIVFALPDILIQRWIHQRDLKMARSEMKQEQKAMFGSREIRRAADGTRPKQRAKRSRSASRRRA